MIYLLKDWSESELWSYIKEELNKILDKRCVLDSRLDKDYNPNLDLAELNLYRGKREMLETIIRLIERQI